MNGRTRPSVIRRATVITTEARRHRLAQFQMRWLSTFLGHITPDEVQGPSYLAPAFSCLTGHLQAMERAAAENPHEPLLIVEDDACFTEAFPYTCEPPHDWDVLWLGAEHIAAPRPVKSFLGAFYVTGWVRPTEIMRTHGYVLREPGAVAEMLRKADPPRIDPYLARLPLRHYVAEPQTVGQAAGPSDTGGAPSEVDRYWHLDSGRTTRWR